jgi:hypothetical protein
LVVLFPVIFIGKAGAAVNSNIGLATKNLLKIVPFGPVICGQVRTTDTSQTSPFGIAFPPSFVAIAEQSRGCPYADATRWELYIIKRGESVAITVTIAVNITFKVYIIICLIYIIYKGISTE